MSLILNIDTSSPVCSVCLSADGSVVAEHNEISGNKHASSLITIIRGLLAQQRVRLKDIAAVALSRGPGSYTGLRIGTSVAKGICYGLDKPLISVPTLQGLAANMAAMCPDPEGIYIPMLDARRSDVYMAVYDSKNNIIKNDRFATVDVVFPDTFAEYNVKNIYFGGSGASKLPLICLNTYFGTVIENLICVASNINAISYKRFVEGIFENLAYFEPFYLKEFEERMKFA